MRHSRAQTMFLTLATLPAAAGIVSDDFESYTQGTFPTDPWIDIRERVADNPTPAPTMSVINTTDSHGNATKALQSNATNGTNGAFFEIEHARTHTIQADMRIDRLAAAGQGWPMTIGFGKNANPDNVDVNQNPQGLIYAWTDRRFYLFIAQGEGLPGRNVPLSGPRFNLDTWYTLSLEVNTETGEFEAKVLDALSGELINSRSLAMTGWDQELGSYDAVTFFDGETPGATTVGQATIDNVNYIPAPSSATMILGAALITARRRR